MEDAARSVPSRSASSGQALTLASKLASARASASLGSGIGDGVFQRLITWERDLEGREREAERVRAESQGTLESLEKREDIIKAAEKRIGQREAEGLKIKVRYRGSSYVEGHGRG